MKVRGASFSVDKNGIKAKEAGDKADVVNAFSQRIQSKLDDTLYHPETHVYYGYQPSNAKPGEISWLFNNYSSSVDTFSSGTAYQYDGYSWKPVPDSNKQIVGSKIYGVDVRGASITGGVFRSEQQNPSNGLPAFFVNTNGQIYANNFFMDIYNGFSGMNGRSYRGTYSPNNAESSGFSMDHGVLQLHAQVAQATGTVVGSNSFWGHTYVEPDYIRMRQSSVKDLTDYSMNYRTDIRSGLITIGTEYNETLGSRLSNTELQIKEKNTFSTASDQMDTSNLSASSLSLQNGNMQFNRTANTIATTSSQLNFSGAGSSVGSIYLNFAASSVNAPTITTTRISHTFGGLVQFGGLTGATINVSNLNKGSDLSTKKDIESLDKNEILSKVLATDIKGYRYKNQNNNDEKNIGPIIDNVNINKQYYVPKEILNKSDERDSDSISIDNATSFSFAAIQELSKQKNDLELRVAKLERKLNQ